MPRLVLKPIERETGLDRTPPGDAQSLQPDRDFPPKPHSSFLIQCHARMTLCTDAQPLLRPRGASGALHHFHHSSLLLHLPACCDIRAIPKLLPTRKRPPHLCLGDHGQSFPCSSYMWTPPCAMADLKKFTARSLLSQLENERREWFIDPPVANRASYKHASTARVWQEGFHPQAIDPDGHHAPEDRLYPRKPGATRLVTAPYTGAIRRRTSGCPARWPGAPV